MHYEFNFKGRPTIGQILRVDDAEDKANVRGFRLIEVIRRAETSLALALIECNANVNFQDEEGMAPLHHAAARGARPLIRALIRTERCDHTLRDKYNRYPSHLARIYARDYAVARLLMKHEAKQWFERNPLKP